MEHSATTTFGRVLWKDKHLFFFLGGKKIVGQCGATRASFRNRSLLLRAPAETQAGLQRDLARRAFDNNLVNWRPRPRPTCDSPEPKRKPRKPLKRVTGLKKRVGKIWTNQDRSLVFVFEVVRTRSQVSSTDLLLEDGQTMDKSMVRYGLPILRQAHIPNASHTAFRLLFRYSCVAFVAL